MHFLIVELHMRIGILGMSHKSAEIETREYVSKACLARISSASAIAEKLHCVVLSTCNRTEIYFSTCSLSDAQSALLNVLKEEIVVPFEHKLYSFFGVDCFMHLARVTAGLDSMIIAESEIQRQVKTAYEQALLNEHLPSCLHFLFQKSLQLGKKIRSDFALTQNQISLEKILFQISQNLLKDILDLPVLLVGNSEINRKVIAYFRRKGMRRIFLCTRSVNSAREMFKKEEITPLSWDNLSSWKDFPIVICGSNAPHCVVYHGRESLSTRLIFDLSIPRNVDPAISRHPQPLLFNIQQLSAMIERQQRKNLLEINRAEDLIQQSVQLYYFNFLEKDKKLFPSLIA